MQHRFGRPGPLIAQQFVDQLVPGHHPVGMAQQQGEQGTLPRPADPHRRAAQPDLQRPENAELHPTAHATPPLVKVSPPRAALARPSAQITP
jgi:hypothetical protein